MRIEELDFDLPASMIAQCPTEPRDACRLMRLCATGDVEHAVFTDLERMLDPGDTLVFNDSKVLPARVQARKNTGGALELLFLRPRSAESPGAVECWEALASPSRRLRAGAEVVVGGVEPVTLVEPLGEGRWLVCGRRDVSLIAIMERYGSLPLPPYIERYPEVPEAYQTVYARVVGSAAAPTAGLHFTTSLLEHIERKGVETAWVTLHVGLDTFLPIRESVVEEHRIHTESFEISEATVRKLKETRSRGGRIVAVGTTSARVLETVGRRGILEDSCAAEDMSGVTGIFITPGHDFRLVDALLTNFHLPRSTVLALTMAFAGVDRLRSAYAEAMQSGYRFFSFGDAMLVENVVSVREGVSEEEGGGSAEP